MNEKVYYENKVVFATICSLAYNISILLFLEEGYMIELMSVCGLILLICISSSKILYKFGVPMLLIFIVLGMLFGSDGIVGSTDAASVLSVLRSQKLNLKGTLAPLLEIESGSNDPIAYMLTIIILTFMSNAGTRLIIPMLIKQIFILGLLAFPSKLPEVFGTSIAISLFIMFIARPLATFIILKWFDYSNKKKIFISWVGFRGAASIVLPFIL